MDIQKSLDQSKWLNTSYFVVTSIIIASAMMIAMFGFTGLLICALGALGLILIPYIYNKPYLFLIFTLFIYPFTRIFSLQDKFVITGALYTLSIPCALWVAKKHFFKVSKNSYYIWGLVLYTIIMALNFLRPGSGIIEVAKDFGRTFYAIFMILSIYDFIGNNKNNLIKISYWMGIMLNAVAFVAFIQYITRKGGFVVEGIFRSRGIFFNFNEYGYIISIFIAFALYFLLTAKSKRARIFWSTSICLNLIALVTTMSKTSMLNTALVFLVLSIFLPWKRRLQLFATASVIGGVITAYLVTSGTLEVIIQRFTNTRSLDWRYQMWRTLESMIVQGNYLIGEGANASRKFLSLVVPMGESYAPHNIYLETTYNYGLVATIPFVLIFLLLIYQGFRILLDSTITSNHNKIIGASIIVVTLITMIQNFVSNAFYDRAVNVIFWVIISIFICWYNIYKTEAMTVIEADKKAVE